MKIWTRRPAAAAPAALDAGRAGIMSSVWRHSAGADLGEPRWTRPMCRPRHDRACAMVSFSRAATRGPMAGHQG